MPLLFSHCIGKNRHPFVGPARNNRRCEGVSKNNVRQLMGQRRRKKVCVQTQQIDSTRPDVTFVSFY
jgi:hypothetical protein